MSLSFTLPILLKKKRKEKRAKMGLLVLFRVVVWINEIRKSKGENFMGFAVLIF